MTQKFLDLKGTIPDKVIAELPSVIETFGFKTPKRLAHFLSQCGHESAGFAQVRENTNYSAERLQQVWPSRYTPELARTHARSPEMIANHVYGNRMGNSSDGDGWKFRGRGYIQLTGKNNYALFNSYVEDDILQNPDLVATKYPLLSAAFFFHHNGLVEYSDTATVKDLTRRINGGTHGLKDREKRFDQLIEILQKPTTPTGMKHEFTKIS